MRIRGRRRGIVGVATVFIATATIASASAGAPAASATGQTKVKGGTAYFAEPPQTIPNYIFPFMGTQFFSVSNISDFQQQMYRPLYWFGQGSEPTLNPSLSLASTPRYSKGNTVLTFTMKPYRWSNGETVSAQDVVFWMNMLKVERLNWAAYAPGTMPDDVKSVTTKGNAVTFTLTGRVNPYWYTYNELSQITPLPMAWDIAATGQKAGGQGCGTASYADVTVKVANGKQGPAVTPLSAAAKSCAAVFTYLSRESGYDPANPKAPNNSLKTYATNPLWQVVDGPWHLTAFDSTGYVAMKPNPHYSGPVKPSLDEFVQLPYTSTGAEFNALVGGKLTVGYLPTEDITSPAKSPLVPGANNPRLAGKFTLATWYPWGIQFAPFNFNSSGDGGEAGKIFRQLYFRQAFQLLIDQPLYIEKIYKNYGVPTYGPVPVLPKNPFATEYETKNPYSYDVKRAIGLLTSHGWNVDPKGVTTCSTASKCGVPAGTPLSFTMEYATGAPATQQLVQAEQASWQQAGIKVDLRAASFNTVIGNSTPCSGKSCTWELQFWGGWVYAPDFYPSGEELFQTGAGSNLGSYSDAKADKLIHDTAFGTATLAGFENYLAAQLPVVWQPNPVYQVTEIENDLQGVTPQNPLLTINPENWYFTK
jgi:peptide/nickel transport system substrate-binding protein